MRTILLAVILGGTFGWLLNGLVPGNGLPIRKNVAPGVVPMPQLVPGYLPKAAK